MLLEVPGAQAAAGRGLLGDLGAGAVPPGCPSTPGWSC